MKKRLLFLVMAFLMASSIVDGQNAPISTIGTVVTSATTASVNINTMNFSNIVSCDIYINYDTLIALADSVTKNPLLNAWIFSVNLTEPGVIRFSWVNYPSVTVPNGTAIFTLHFSKVSTGVTPLQFNHDLDKNCEMYDPSAPLNDDPTANYWLNGSLEFLHVVGNAPKTSAPVVNSCIGAATDVPVTVTDFDNIRELNLTLNYDPNVLGYTGFTNTSSFPGLNVNIPVAGTAVITGTTAYPGYSIADNNALVTLHFNFFGGSGSLAWFDNGSSSQYKDQFLQIMNDAPQSTYYLNGSIACTSSPPTGTAPAGLTGINACYINSATPPLGVPAFDPTQAKANYTDVCSIPVESATLNSTVISGTHCGWQVVYTFTVTDSCGNNLSNQTITHTGSDQTAPTLTGVLPTGQTGLNECMANAPTGPDASTIAALYSDNCGGTISVSKSTQLTGNNCSWSVTYTYTVEDECGNTVNPSPAIVYSGGDLTVPNLTGSIPAGQSGMNLCFDDIPAGPSENDIAAQYTDNCGGVITVIKSGTPVGDNTAWSVTYSYEVIDACGNAIDPDPEITYSGWDQSPPVISDCPANIPAGTDAGFCSAMVTWTDPTSLDACDGPLAWSSLSHTPGSIFPLGTTTVTYIFTDVTGNTASCSFDVIVSDDDAPVVSACPADIPVSNDPGLCSAIVSWTEPTATDACDGALSFDTRSHAPGSTFALGTTTVTYVFEDAAGNTVECSFDVIVSDTAVPVVAGCPADILTGTDAGFCSAVVSWTEPTATDICDGSLSWFSRSHAPGDAFALGTTTVTYVFQDAAGNSATCSFDISVSDDDAPAIINCPAVVNSGTDPGLCAAVVGWTQPTANDACDGALSYTSRSHAPNTMFPLGSTTVTYWFSDVAGNSSSCSFDVIVSDDDPPVVLNCPDSVSVTTNAGFCTATATWSEPSAFDMCSGSLTYNSRSHTPGSTFALGITTVTYIYIDGAGNSASCSFDVIVRDDDAPIISNCPSNIITGTNNGLCSAVVTWSEPTAMDDCDGALTFFSRSHAPGSTFALGTTTVTYVFMDAAGNSASCSFDVIVSDDDPPLISNCPSDILIGTNTASCSAVVTWTEPTAIDACDGVVSYLSRSHAPGSTFALGTITVTYVFEDAEGNSDICTFDVIVSDDDAPMISNCPSNIAITTSTGLCSGIATWAEPTAVDDCDGALSFFTRSHVPGSTFALGTTTVTYIFQDAAGNTASCSFNVIVSDDDAPLVNNCPSNIIIGTNGGLCSAVVTWTQPTATDDCDGALTFFSRSHAPGATFALGTTTVTYIFMDAAGNSASCSFNVIVSDDDPPLVINCPSNILIGTNTGNCSAIVTWTEPTANDACSGSLSFFTRSHAPGATFALGTTTVTYIFQDAAGNSASCNFNVTVNDDDAPVLTGCPGTVNVGTGTGTCSATATWTEPSASDACDGALSFFTRSHAPGSTFGIGSTTVTYVFKDATGNTSTCSFAVVVTDNAPPVITIIGNNPDTVCLFGSYTDAGATANDNCDGNISNLISTNSNVNTAVVGSYSVTYDVMDAAGNPAVQATRTVNVVACLVEVDGHYKYHNSAQTPLNNIIVQLKQGGVTIYSDTTDATGYYNFPAVASGVYDVVSLTVKPNSGAINSLDAGTVNAWGTGPQYPIEKVKFIAGDVLKDDYMDAGDAARINYYYLSLGSPTWAAPVGLWSFWKAGDIISVNNFSEGLYPTISPGSSDLTQNFLGLVTGDFNQSFVPGTAKANASVTVNDGQSILVAANSDLALPIVSLLNSDVGAISLAFDYPADKVEVLGVFLNNNPAQPIPFKASNGQLRIGWFSDNATSVVAGDALISLQLRVKGSVSAGTMIRFSLNADPLNELGDNMMQLINNAQLRIDVLEVTNTGITNSPSTGTLQASCYPNPLKGSGNLNFTLPKAGMVSLEVLDILGKDMMLLLDAQMSAGNHVVPIDAKAWPAGIYMLRLNWLNGSESLSKTLKIVVGN